MITAKGNDSNIGQEFKFQSTTSIVFSAGGYAIASSNLADDARVEERDESLHTE